MTAVQSARRGSERADSTAAEADRRTAPETPDTNEVNSTSAFDWLDHLASLQQRNSLGK